MHLQIPVGAFGSRSCLWSTKPNTDPSRDTNVSTDIRIAVELVEHKTECISQPRPENSHSHSDRGLACGTQSRMHIPAATRMCALTFGSRSCLRNTKPNAYASRERNVSTHIQIAVVPAEHKAECRSYDKHLRALPPPCAYQLYRG